MIRHYLKSAIRNLRKYRAQNIISVMSIGVSVTLFAAVSSILVHFRATPIAYQSQADKMCVFYLERQGIKGSLLPVEELKDHQFKSFGNIYFTERVAHTSLGTTTDKNGKKFSENYILKYKEPDFLAKFGYKSAINGKQLGQLSPDEIFVSELFAKKNYGNCRSAVGNQIEIQVQDQTSRTYTIKDVIRTPAPFDLDIGQSDYVLSLDRFSGFFMSSIAYIELHNGFTPEDAARELEEFLPLNGKSLILKPYREWYREENATILVATKSIIIFLFIFMLVSIASWLRHQMQTMQNRCREIAIRTISGSRRNQMATLFSIEAILILAASLFTTIALNGLIQLLLMPRISHLIRHLDLVANIPALTCIAYGIILAICLATIWIATKHMTRDRKGPVEQVRKSTSNYIRNAWLTIQIAICIQFLAVTASFLSGAREMEKNYNIPQGDTAIKRALDINIVDADESDKQTFFEQVARLESVEMLVNNMDGFVTEYEGNGHLVQTYIQREDEIAQFYGVDIIPSSFTFDPKHNALVSKKIKDTLIENGLWETGKIKIMGDVYDIAGEYATMPFSTLPESVIITDSIRDFPSTDKYILPVKGREKEAEAKIRDLLVQTFPERRDFKVEKLWTSLASTFVMKKLLQIIIYILAGISLITTIAGIYSAVSLDTRRRRKEMALRKVNGAKTKDICRIFARIHIIILAVSTAIAIPPSIIAIRWASDYFKIGMSPWMPFISAVLIIIAVTIITVAQKIRDVMRVDPAEYIKY